MEQVKGDRKNSQLLKVSEVAKCLRVDDTTVRRWIKLGALEAVQLPGRGPNKKYRVAQETLDVVLSGVNHQ